jgi:hypothetical protein
MIRRVLGRFLDELKVISKTYQMAKMKRLIPIGGGIIAIAATGAAVAQAEPAPEYENFGTAGESDNTGRMSTSLISGSAIVRF